MQPDVKPLVLDIDGTFLRTDMLWESLWAALGKDPWGALKAVFSHFASPARLKRDLAEIAELRVDLLPVQPDLKELVERDVASGRKVMFASASDQQLVSQLAEVHGLDAESVGSTPEHNLKGSAKAQYLVSQFGEGGFDYAGDSRADMKVWAHSDNALVLGGSAQIERELAAKGKNVTGLGEGWKLRDLTRALRPHQWVKNVLLLLPMLAAHQFSAMTFVSVLLGMISFSAAASCIYIVNDLLDLEADRLHATKHRRPFASGAVPITVGMAACGLSGLIALGLAALLHWTFIAVIIVYMSLSLAYSLSWKRKRWIDIATLASLYTIRVVGGAAAGAVAMSGFMLSFIFPIFLTLGCVKRLTELTLAADEGKLPGRGYARSDRPDLLNIAWIGTAAALVNFFLYTLSPQALELYPTRWLLWLAMVPIAMWLIRMVRLGYFGKQDYDPIVFALRDKRGLGLLLLTLSIMFYAAGLWQEWFGF